MAFGPTVAAISSGPPRRRYSRPVNDEKLWRYRGLAKLWSWALIVAAIGLLGLAIPLEAGSPGGLDDRYLISLVAVSVITAAILYPFFLMWLRRSAMPSLRLEQAEPASGRRLLAASSSDWRRWGAITTVLIFVGGAAVMVFLVALLGRGGTAEGVTIGMIAAWGLATLRDTRKISSAEAEQGRRYYAACKRPTGVAQKLVWIPAEGSVPDATAEGAPRARA
jgi:hypothetical protein